MDGLKSRIVEHAAAVRTYPGESVSGDAWSLEESPGVVRAALADGLGHGPEAAAAAQRALTLVRAGGSEDVTSVMKRCHAGLQPTRGAALTLVHLDTVTDTLTWLGVGNVNCVLARAEGQSGVLLHSVVPARGVLGRRLPPLTAREYPITAGDILILTSDGIDAHFQHRLPALVPLQPAADDILSRFGNGNDDALVVLLRYRGAPS